MGLMAGTLAKCTAVFFTMSAAKVGWSWSFLGCRYLSGYKYYEVSSIDTAPILVNSSSMKT
jgi:hypothetical protein